MNTSDRPDPVKRECLQCGDFTNSFRMTYVKKSSNKEGRTYTYNKWYQDRTCKDCLNKNAREANRFRKAAKQREKRWGIKSSRESRYYPEMN